MTQNIKGLESWIGRKIIGTDGAEVTSTTSGSKELLDVSIGVSGLHELNGAEHTHNLPNVTVTAKDIIGDDSTELTNWAAVTGGRAILDYFKMTTTLTGATAKLDLDIVFFESTISYSGASGDAWTPGASDLLKIIGLLEIREDDWITEAGTTDHICIPRPDKLGQKIKCPTGSTSIFYSIIWRGADLAVGASETLKIHFGNTQLNT